ncbi:MAG: zinc-binding dehydrogenase [Hyphomicrobiaceae bacterium]|nr:MAG: zinc-binding dehydrogenase [Hyphomicrobiaceae bacterium]
MKGVVFAGNRKIELLDFPDPSPGEDDVVLEIKASGMCGSDLHVYRSAGGGPAMAAALGLGGEGGAVIGGHEPCGVVVARGRNVSERKAPLGARVMQHHYSGCGVCPDCNQGWSQLCKQGAMTVYGITGNGAHARFMKVPAHTLVPLPEELSFEEGAAISCGTGTAWGALRRMRMAGGGTLAVFGQGPVGLSATMLGKAMGMRVIAIDIADERLELAASCGADDVVNPSRDDPVEVLRALTRGAGADYALECSSATAARVAAVRGTRTWGTACYVGEGGNVTLEVSPDMLRRQITLMGSWTFSKIGHDECARFIAEHKLPLHVLITHRFKLDEAERAYQLFDRQTMGKGVILPS